MKKLIVIGIVAVMVMGMAAMASAAVDTDWIIQLRASLNNANYTNNNGSTQFGTKTTAKDIMVAGEDTTFPGLASTVAEISCSDLAGSDPRWMKDIRAPLNDTDRKVMFWHLSMYTGASFPSTGTNMIALTAWNPTSFDLDQNSNTKLWLYEGTINSKEDIAGKTLVWEFDPTKNGTSAAPAYTALYAPGSTYTFTLVAGQVPEPGSMLAMLSGLVGLVGFGIRRRK